MSDPMNGEWARLDESPTASAQMIQWHAPETFRVVTEATEAQIRDLLEEREELLTEIRRLRRGSHPAGRALPEYKAIALREAMEARDAEHEGGGGA